jgi:putative NADH-flavin reductase
MNLLVVGASGRTGRQIVEQGLGHGHRVRAVVHTTPLGLEHDRLQVVHGDVRDLDFMLDAVDGTSAVASALGARPGPDSRVLPDGIATIIHAMASVTVAPLAAVSAAGAGNRTDPGLTLGYRMLIKTALKSTYDAFDEMEQRIMASDLDWTIVRPVGLTDGPLTGEYRVSLDGAVPPKSSTVSRADVAAFVLKSLETGAFLKRAVVVAD